MTFVRHTSIPAHTQDLGCADQLKWSAPFPVPPLGSTVRIRINGIGPAKVVGYGEVSGYLGVMTVPLDPPVWWIEQNGQPGEQNAALAFGAEIEKIA